MAEDRAHHKRFYIGPIRHRHGVAVVPLFSWINWGDLMVGFDVSPMSSGSRQLTSWKEIAHHLGVNIRTAQRWERERGLPVTRIPGARSRVSVDTASLDTWKQQLARMAKVDDRCYVWPLGPGLTVEVRFVGADLGPTHIDLLREYFDLFKTSLR